jgi:hypothetical protein
MEYESVTNNVLLLIDSILQTAKQLQYARLSWHVRCLSFLDSINIFPLLFGSEHYQSLEITLTTVG